MWSLSVFCLEKLFFCYFSLCLFSQQPLIQMCECTYGCRGTRQEVGKFQRMLFASVWSCQVCVRCSDADLTGLWSDMFSPLGLSLNLVSSAFSLRCWFWLDHPDPLRSSLVLRASYCKKLLWIRMHGHLRNLLSSLRTTESGKHGHYLAAIDCFYCFIVKFLFYLHVYMTFLLPHRSLFIYFVVLFILYSHFQPLWLFLKGSTDEAGSDWTLYFNYCGTCFPAVQYPKFPIFSMFD